MQVKEEDKLPENICDNCVKQLEDISTFIITCENNDLTLRKIILQEYEKSLAAQTDFCDTENDNEQCDEPDDLKNEHDNSDNSFCEYSIKQEFIIEPNFDETNNVEGPVSCENCSENFPDSQSLNDHYKEIIMCRPRDYDIDTSSVPNIIDYLKKNKKEKKLKKKKDKCEGEPEIIKGRQLKGKRRFLCCYCGKNYTRKNGLDRHILSHTGVKPFECKECGKRYITKDTLKTHLLTHTGVKSHKCMICQKMFTQSSHLSYHMRRHSGEKPYSCTFCGKGFLSNYHLERHKLMHTGVKPFECKQCGKQFVRGTTLRDHLLIHTGEKPFQCQHCGKQFNRKQSLTNHVLVHTGQVRHNNGGRIGRLHNSELEGRVGQNNRGSEVGLNSDTGGLLTLHGSSGIIAHNTSSAGLNSSGSDGIMAIGGNLMFTEPNPVNNNY